MARRAAQTLEIAERRTSAARHRPRPPHPRPLRPLRRPAPGPPPGPEAQAQAEQAVSGLRAAGDQDIIPRGLLTRAWLRHALGDPAGAQSDLAEAERIASRGGMQLHLADCALHRARLFRDRQALAQARRLIETCHYGRRLPELEDAERAAAGW